MTGAMGANAAERTIAGEQIVFQGVTVVDTHDGKLSPNMAVFVRNGKIAKIVPATSATADGSAVVIDARGKYLVPGFNDFHAHPLSSSDPQGSLTLMIANGITGFREMGAWNNSHERRRQGTLVPIGAPELLELASETLTPLNAATPPIAVAEVQKQLKAGADFVKIIEYSPAVFDAIATECKRVNARFLGHLSPAVDVRYAIKAGMKSLEHLGPRDAILLGCSTEETALRPVPPPRPAGASPATVAAPANALPRSNGPIPADVIARSVANPVLSTTTAELGRYKRVIETYNESKMQDLAGAFVAAGTWQVPTLIRVRTMDMGNDAVYRNDPNLMYVPAKTRSMWQELSKQFDTTFAPDARETLKRLYVQAAATVKPFKRAGANMMAGSDFGGGFVVAGFGLHNEFDLLEQAGLTPLDVLQMTTLNGAKFLGREATMGSVAVGKDANLVLLDANPIASVQHLHRIHGVMRAGTYYPATALAGMKQHTAERVAAGVAYVEPQQPMCC